MPSVVKQITNEIENRLEAIIPGFSKASYIWSIATNNSKTSQMVFRVLPDQGNSTTGTLRTITMSQKFNVLLTTNYTNKNSSDSALQDAIEVLYVAIETVTRDAMARHFSTLKIINVESVELAAPEIDNDNHIVSIGASYTIIYRME